MSTYAELLKTREWRTCRERIIAQANARCDDCGRCRVGCEWCDHHNDTVESLEVHHRYYERGKKPWEYPDVAFLCLCRVCHEERTLLNDVIKVAVGLLSKDAQERLLHIAKGMLFDVIARNRESDERNPYDIDLRYLPEEIRMELKFRDFARVVDDLEGNGSR